MKKHSFFGTHLYSQIIYPMLVASVAVGIVAALVSVWGVHQLTNDWVARMAGDEAEHAVERARAYGEQVQHESALIAHDVEQHIAENPGSLDAAASSVRAVSEGLKADTVVLLDGTGKVVAAAGAHQDRYTSTPLGTSGLYVAGGSKILFTSAQGGMAIAASQALNVPGGYSIVVAHQVDDQFMDALGVNHQGVLGLYDADFSLVDLAAGSELSPDEIDAAETTLRAPNASLVALLKGAQSGGRESGTFEIAGSTYNATARKVTFESVNDEGLTAYVVGAIDQTVAEEAGSAARNAAFLWSLIAVVALVFLGRIVARRVSDPLVDLAASTRRIAEGDFSAKVEVTGATEVAELSESFNVMTDSLRERSESLTKKVLELATLYEMSRALGSTLDMDELLTSVLDSALRIFDLDSGYVVLRDKDTSALAIRAIRGAGESGRGGDAVRSTMSEWVVREGRPLIFNPDSSGDAQIDAVTGARAALCVPLVSSEGTIGSITIGSSRAGYRFDSDDVRLLSTIANHVTMAIGNIELFLSLQEAYLATVRSLATAVDAKDSYTRGHSDHVARYSMLIAERMGLSHEQRVALEMAAYLHDIGKIGVAEEILLKPGRLSDLEMEQMRHHPLIGANILKPVAFPWAINPVVRHHHEAYDGTGYPAGLKGDEIPLLARILTVADSFEAMTADRPYRQGMSVGSAVDELNACSGTQFDPRVVSVFVDVVSELEDSGEISIVRPADDVASEEARAIFSALVDGVFSSFRRLGGPRLASNVETEIDDYFREHGLEFRIQHGRVVFLADPPADAADETEAMRAALRRIDATITRFSGGTLLEHFYSDALAGISEHMRTLAVQLDFYRE